MCTVQNVFLCVFVPKRRVLATTTRVSTLRSCLFPPCFNMLCSKYCETFTLTGSFHNLGYNFLGDVNELVSNIHGIEQQNKSDSHYQLVLSSASRRCMMSVVSSMKERTFLGREKERPNNIEHIPAWYSTVTIIVQPEKQK